jgi:hypothetical protein
MADEMEDQEGGGADETKAEMADEMEDQEGGGAAATCEAFIQVQRTTPAALIRGSSHK